MWLWDRATGEMDGSQEVTKGKAAVSLGLRLGQTEQTQRGLFQAEPTMSLMRAHILICIYGILIACDYICQAEQIIMK